MRGREREREGDDRKEKLYDKVDFVISSVPAEAGTSHVRVCVCVRVGVKINLCC